jgi:regulator of protease activity HflC (stomatin/prohibitin superfamily)
VLGVADLDTLLSDREHLNGALQTVIDSQTEPWGIKVTSVEIKDVEIPERMQHAIARQAEAERERRAKIINAEGEFQAAAKLGQAADVISQNPVTLQLRYLQTLREIGANNNSTVVFPMPIDLMKPMLQVLGSATANANANGLAAEVVGQAAELRADPAPELTSEPSPELGAAIVGLELDTGTGAPAEPEPAREVDGS